MSRSLRLIVFFALGSPFNRSTLNNYLMWRLAHNYLPYLSREFWEVLDIHKRDTLGKRPVITSVSLRITRLSRFPGAKESVDRWEIGRAHV